MRLKHIVNNRVSADYPIKFKYNINSSIIFNYCKSKKIINQLILIVISYDIFIVTQSYSDNKTNFTWQKAPIHIGKAADFPVVM